jgi:signal peptidase
MAFYQKSNFRSILLFLVITAILWFVFAPVQAGGSVGYVIIEGNSMEPEISVGDLVISRSGANYGINQRVVYKHPQVGFVFHRIIDQEDDTYILKGDNNDWVDSYQPTTDEIVGSYWFKIPTGGLVIRKLREPIIFTGFTLIILIIIASLIIFQKPLRSKKSKLKSISMENQSPPSIRGVRQEILLVLAIIAISALVLAVVAYT